MGSVLEKTLVVKYVKISPIYQGLFYLQSDSAEARPRGSKPKSPARPVSSSVVV